MAGTESIGDLVREVDVIAGRAPVPSPPAAVTHASSNAAPAIRPAEILGGDFVRAARERLRLSSAPVGQHATRGFDAFAASDFAAAAVELSEAMKLDQANAAIAFVLGWAREGTGAHREAISAWRAAAASDPKMVPAHLALADAYLRLSEPALAAQAVRAGLAALPDSPELLAKLAEIDKKF